MKMLKQEVYRNREIKIFEDELEEIHVHIEDRDVTEMLSMLGITEDEAMIFAKELIDEKRI